MRHHELPELTSQTLDADFIAEQDAILVVTDHSDFDFDFIVRHAQLVVDTRNATDSVDTNLGVVRRA